MPDVFRFGSLAGHWIAFALFSAIALFIGFSITAIAARLAAPAGQLSYYGTTTRARRALGAVTATALLAVVWYWLWSGFHEIEVGRDAVTLRYRMPPRSRVLSRQEITGQRWRWGAKSSRIFVITTRSGDEYQSMQVSIGQAEAGKMLDAIRRAMERRDTAR
jgi:hypothetical protein